MRTLPLIRPGWCLSEAALGRAVQLHLIDHGSVNTSVNQINKSCTGRKHSPYIMGTDISPALLPARAPGHGEGPLSLGALVLALPCLPSLRSLGLGPRRGLVQALEAVAGQPLQHCEVRRSREGQKVRR